MTTQHRSEGEARFFAPGGPARWKRWALVYGVPPLLVLLVLVILWNVFFRYVPPGMMLVVVAKDGADLPPNQVVAEKGQKGIQREVLGEGWHFIVPILYTTELKPNVVVPAGKVGVVTALGGDPPADGRVLAEKDGEQGIRRQVLPPGSYRLNPYAYRVDLADATHVEPGYVGVLRRLLGKDNTSRFAARPEDKGILQEVLQPGLYYINPKEFEVIHAEVGIEQTTFHRDTAIIFPVKDGNTIRLDCTVEWEVLPRDVPALTVEFGTRRDEKGRTVLDEQAVERNVIDQHVRKISRDRGFNYGAQDFLEGDKREAFQQDFTQELTRVCKEKSVAVRSAFIRDIVIPEDFLKQKRDKQLAAETRLTNEAKELTAQSEAEVEQEKSLVEQSVAKVKAETGRLVAGTDRERENLKALNEAEIEKLKAEYGAKIAELDAERKRVSGEAEAQASKLKETAKSALYKMKLDVFGNDGSAYLRYTLAQQLNPKMTLRLFHSGPGTLWTNMDGKHMNVLLQAPGTAAGTGKEGKAAAGK